MNLSQLEFGSLLTYTPRGNTPKSLHSKNVMIALKRDQFVNTPPILVSDWIAKRVQDKITELSFGQFFRSNTILVPVPKSSLMQPSSLWVPERIATALVAVGLGKKVESCLIRANAVPKAASSSSNMRPTAEQHYESISVQGILSEPDEILLVDDVVTRGATLLGCANRLADAFPKSHIHAFAAMRTISNSNEFENIYAPCIGTITLSATAETFRRP
jgi:predicted amidophosphoribosyltransferase